MPIGNDVSSQFLPPFLPTTQILAALSLPPSSLPSSSSSSSSSSWSYPSALVGAPVAPLIYCVSLGPKEGILVFNDLVVRREGGREGGRVRREGGKMLTFLESFCCQA